MSGNEYGYKQLRDGASLIAGTRLSRHAVRYCRQIRTAGCAAGISVVFREEECELPW